MMTMTKELTARKLSGALGRKIAPSDIFHVTDTGLVLLVDGTAMSVEASNRCYVSGDGWYRNGVRETG